MRNRFIITTNKYILKFAFRIVNNNADKQQKGGFFNPYILYIPIKIPAYKLNKLIDKPQIEELSKQKTMLETHQIVFLLERITYYIKEFLKLSLDVYA